jgi:uncharacterized membrane protein
MARRFAFRPALTLRGRKFFGIRGFSGKPFHPPLTDIPVAAYMFAGVGDVISYLFNDSSWSGELYRAVGWVMIGGAIVSLLAALTGYWDWLKTTPKGTQARRTVNAHAWTMLTVTALVLIDLAIRLGNWNEASTPVVLMILTVIIAALTFVGATIGGSLVFDYGFNVANAGDHPVYHRSERNLLPGEKPAPTDQAS